MRRQAEKETVPESGTKATDDRRERMLNAWRSLSDTVLEVANLMESKMGERCPYRAATDECTFRGGCVNKQRKSEGKVLCGGDHLLKRA
ncbi:MAG: hypothetical protein V2A74_14330 [bacterium]